jgi:agmatine deiminase
LPAIGFTNFSGINDPAFSLARSQTYRYVDSLRWMKTKHTVSVGGEVRRMDIDRDTDPAPNGAFSFTGLMTSQLTAITWRFNAWAKYSDWKNDEKIGLLMAQAANAAELQPMVRKQRVVLEGGSIDVNGLGTLLTTEECLLSETQQRNPGMKREDYEKIFADYLGLRNVIWLGSGIVGDDTHGHVDDITRFVAPDTVVTAVESDPNDPNYEPLRENIRRLREATDQDGKSFSIVELPMPAPVFFEGRRLPASYANFYVANGLVLVPVFNDPNDRFALDILADLFPDRDVVGIYSGDLIWGFGAIHCMTQQQPKISP